MYTIPGKQAYTEQTKCVLILLSAIIQAQQGKGPSPLVVERFQNVASQLMNQRIIRLGGAVDDDGCNLIVAQLLWLDANDPEKDITLYVNSPGAVLLQQEWLCSTPCDTFVLMCQLSASDWLLRWEPFYLHRVKKANDSVYRIAES